MCVCDSPREMVMVNTAMDARRFHEKDALFIFLGSTRREPCLSLLFFVVLLSCSYRPLIRWRRLPSGGGACLGLVVLPLRGKRWGSPGPEPARPVPAFIHSSKHQCILQQITMIAGTYIIS